MSHLASFPRPCRAVVVGASGGIGAALARRTVAAGLTTHALARHAPEPCDGVMPGRLDLRDEASIAAAVAALGDGPPIRLGLVASGLLHDATLAPEKSLRALDPDRLARSFAINAIGPALVAKYLVPRLPREGRSVFAVLSARVGSISDNRIGGWYGYRASKAALNQIVRTLAIEVARSRPEAIVVALHPGTVSTALSKPFRGDIDADRLFTPDQAAGYLVDVVDRLAPGDTGGFFAWDGSPIAF